MLYVNYHHQTLFILPARKGSSLNLVGVPNFSTGCRAKVLLFQTCNAIYWTTSIDNVILRIFHLKAYDGLVCKLAMQQKYMARRQTIQGNAFSLQGVTDRENKNSPIQGALSFTPLGILEAQHG